MNHSIDPVLEKHLARLAAEAEAAQGAERLKIRASLFNRLAELKVEADKSMPLLQRVEAEARKRFEAAQSALEAARKELATAQTAQWNASCRFTSKRAEIEKELRETADPAIPSFVQEMEEAFERERRIPLTVNRERTGEFYSRDTSPVFKTESNYDQRRIRIEGLRKASAVASELVYEALDGKSLARRLQDLRDALPPRFGE